MTRRLAPRPKNWGTEAIGLFFSEDAYRLDDVVDLDAWTWVSHANCVGSDPELFFHPGHDADVTLLASICGACAVRVECLEHALTVGEKGWWGGMSEADRKFLVKDIE